MVLYVSLFPPLSSYNIYMQEEKIRHPLLFTVIGDFVSYTAKSRVFGAKSMPFVP